MMGAVLAGGQSVRFGKNKALEDFGGIKFIERAAQSLRSFCDSVIIVANDLAPYAALGLTLVRDVIPHQGPLGGIYTALFFSDSEWVFVKATDMPFLVPEMANLMIGARDGFDAVVPVKDGFYEPLFALYNRRCLHAVARQLEGQERQIVRFFRKVKVRSIAEEEWRSVDPDALSLKNVNTPEDLAEIQ